MPCVTGLEDDRTEMAQPPTSSAFQNWSCKQGKRKGERGLRLNGGVIDLTCNVGVYPTQANRLASCGGEEGRLLRNNAQSKLPILFCQTVVHLVAEAQVGSDWLGLG